MDKTNVAEAQLIQQRREKKDRYLQSGKTPYGHRYVRTGNLEQIKSTFDKKIIHIPGQSSEPDSTEVRIAGRLMTRRDLGKLCFAHIKDQSAQLQLKFNRQDLGDEGYKEFLKEFDLGDIVGATGYMCRTKTGELTLQVKTFELLSKSLRPWPEKYHGVTDVETRSRYRELDLGTNDENKNRFMSRFSIIQSIRSTLSSLDFIEVETPIMQQIPGGAAAKPFVTHHEALDTKLYMRIAPELYLKRLLVGGFERVYELGRAFRNEGIDTRHNPEFTILEAYQAYGDVNDMMDLAERIIHDAAQKIKVQNISYRGENCDISKPFQRASLVDLFKKYLDVDFVELCRQQHWRTVAEEKGLRVSKDVTERKCFDLLFDERILKHLDQPTFVLDYPSAFSPLAKTKPGNPLLADRFELFIAKEEVANAYTEQNDPDEQSRKFSDELAKRQSGDEEAMPSDDIFIYSLEHAMPPAGGLGIGIDRLTMILTGTDSIREVILFPHLKPQ